jgi:hypothetical protein
VQPIPLVWFAYSTPLTLRRISLSDFLKTMRQIRDDTDQA